MIATVLGFFAGPWGWAVSLLGKVSLKAWLILGAIAAVVLLHFDLQHRAVEAQAHADQVAEAARDAARAVAQAKVNLAAQVKLDALGGQLVQAQLDVQEAQAARDQAAAKLAAALKERTHTHGLTPAENARCPDVPRHYLLLRTDAAAYANGIADTRPAGAASEPDDSRSGVSLAPVTGEDGAGPYLIDTDIDAAVAFRQLRAKLDDERKAADALRSACTTTIDILKGASP